MKILIVTLFIALSMSIPLQAQQWEKTLSDPDGAGVTDILLTPQNTLLVTTSSWSSLPGGLGGVRRSTNDGASWQNPLEGFNGRTLCLGDNGVVFASFWPYPMDEAIYRSTNDGVNWSRLHSVSAGDNIFSIESKDNNNTIFIGTRNGVKRSTNAGVNWAYVNTGIPANSWVRDIETDTSSGIVVAATTNGVFSTTNNGASWQMATGIQPGDTIVKIEFDYPIDTLDGTDQTRVYYGSNGGYIYDSFHDSEYLVATFLAIFGDAEITGIGVVVLRHLNKKQHQVTTFAEPGEGAFLVSDDFLTWTEQTLGLPHNIRLSCTCPQYDTLGPPFYITKYSGCFTSSSRAQVWKYSYLVGVELISSQIPEIFALEQNYPNPFNPSTNIKFDILGKEAVRLSVFNSLGQEVAVLVDQRLSAGSYEYKFDAGGLSSGIYFYKLQSENFSETKKMLLVK
jgi:hypothetical protein